MLKQLYVKNLVLIEEALVPFHPGFNIISGETGAGKSALMAALHQIQGSRADTQLIRHGFDKGIVEGVFDIDSLSNVKEALHEAGIEHDDGDELIIRREISSSGKSRLFINNQLTHLSLLKGIAGSLFEIVGQRANQQLFNLNHHLEILDLFGSLSALRETYSTSFAKETEARKKLQNLKEGEQQRLRDIEVCQMELEELETAQLKEGEEEELFAEYTKLTNTETLSQLSDSIYSSLEQQVLPALRLIQQSAEDLAALDSPLEETQELLKSSMIELQELAHTYRCYNSGIEHDPYRTETINDRLSLINKMKKKYGPSIEEALEYKATREEDLFKLENAENEIDELTEQTLQFEKESVELAARLSEERSKAAKLFSEEMTKELRDLNMPNAVFTVVIEKQERSRTGQDKVEFYFAPNKGEKTVPIRECASGGEISRLQLSIQTLLAGKEAIPCLVFDEIDANIGGLTASIVGKKLKQIGENHQLLCITHFAQVADEASHHVQISKNEKGDRTITEVNVLNQESKQSELMRMAGK